MYNVSHLYRLQAPQFYCFPFITTTTTSSSSSSSSSILLFSLLLLLLLPLLNSIVLLLLLLLLLLLNSIVLPPPPPPQFYCSPSSSSSSILLFSLLLFNYIVLNYRHRHHNSLRNCKPVSLVQSAIMSQVVKNNRGFLQLLAHCPTHQCEFLLKDCHPASSSHISSSFIQCAQGIHPLSRRKQTEIASI